MPRGRTPGGLSGNGTMRFLRDAQCAFPTNGDKIKLPLRQQSIDIIRSDVVGCILEMMITMRIMAVDYGSARTGVAVSDPTGLIAGEAFTIHEKNMDRLVEELAALCRERNVGKIVVGNPKHMNAGEGERSELSKELAGRLERALGLPVALWDERLTTVSAHRILSELDRRGKRRRDTADAVAAGLILEGYLQMTDDR